MPTTAKKTAKKSAKKAARKTAKKATRNSAPKKATTKSTRKKVKKAATRKVSASKADNKRTPAPSAAGRQTAARNEDASVHCTVASTGEWSMVLPTSTIAEITDYVQPAPLENAPEWLLGQVEWEDWQVPVISYGALIDGAKPDTATPTSRIMVVKSLSSTSRVPFIGVLVSRIPKLTKVSQSDMEVTGDDGAAQGVHCKLKLGEQAAVIPDLERLSQLVGHAAYGTVDKQGTVAQA